MTTELTLTKIREELAALVVIMTDKGLRMPEARFWMTANEADKFILTYRKEAKGYDSNYEHFATLADALAWVSALPSPEQNVLADFHAKIADAIDYGTEHSLPDDMVTPLRTVGAAVYEKLLPSPDAAKVQS